MLKKNPNVQTVRRLKYLEEVFHLYHINVKKRDLLKKFLIKHNIDAKVHYPIPIHLQPASSKLGYKLGDFPVTEKQSQEILTLPINQFLNKDELNRIVTVINEFRV